MEWLNDLIASVTGESEKPRSSEQLEQAQRRDSAKPATAQQDADAKAAGFKNHKERMAYLRQRENRTGGTVESEKKSASSSLLPAWHPKVLLEYVDKAIKDATKDD